MVAWYPDFRTRSQITHGQTVLGVRVSSWHRFEHFGLVRVQQIGNLD